MALKTFRYQIVFKVFDKANNVIASGIEVLLDGATPPEFNVGDPWRFELPTGMFIETTVTVSTRKWIIDSANNWIVQYDFTLTEV